MASLNERLAKLGFDPTQRQSKGNVAFEELPGTAVGDGDPADGSVSVVVRCRPALMQSEAIFGLAAEVHQNKISLKLQTDEADGHERRRLSRLFKCNKYCGPTAGQSEVFESATSIVARTMEGYNGTIFCYGVTGSGKTYTMSGPPEDISKEQRDPDTVGISQRVAMRIFEHIRDNSSQGEVYSIEASFLEIYSSDGSREQLIDLLCDEEKHLEVKQDPLSKHAFVCEGLRRVSIRTPDEMCEVLRKGQQRLQFMETSANCHSSRSHCVFILSIECLMAQSAGDPIVQRGKLMLVDLAGSESVKGVRAKTDASEELRRKQAIGINRVLSSLATVVNNMNRGLSSGHRDSALTMLLRDCLGGNSRALLIATVGPELEGLEETTKTLTFAQQMMAVKNVTSVNRIEQDQSALMQMRQRHADCIRILEEKTDEAKDEEAEQFQSLKNEMDSLSSKLLTKESAEATLEAMRNEQFRKIDEMRDEMSKAMTHELEKMRQQSLQDLNTLRQSVEKHVSHSDDPQQSRHAEEQEARLRKMQSELQDAARAQRTVEEEAADLRVRLAAAEERSKMLQLRQEDLRKDRANFDEERKALRQQSEQQWQKLSSVEGDTQKFKAEAEVQRAEIARLHAVRAEEIEQMAAERDGWRSQEAEHQRQISDLHRRLQEARREAELHTLREESERRETSAQLRLQIERLEAESSSQAEQLSNARRVGAQLEADLEDAKQCQEALRTQGAFDLKQCKDELDEATGREEELMHMLHEIQEGIISASGPPSDIGE